MPWIKRSFFVLGCDDLTIAVDHKPLLGIFSDRSLDMANDRLRNLKEKTLRYRFKMMHIPGLKNKAADTLSRHPSHPTDHAHADSIACLQDCPAPKTSWRYLLSGICSVEAVDSLQSLQAITWDGVRDATTSDPSMCRLLEYINHGFPQTKDSIPADLQPYFRFRADLFTVDGVALYKDLGIIPPALRNNILNNILNDMLLTKESPQCCRELTPLYFGLVSHQLSSNYGKDVRSATAWPHLSQVHLLHLPSAQHTLFKQSALTSSTTTAITIVSLSIGTPTTPL